MARIDTFKINEAARSLHQQGLDTAKQDPEAAREIYENAIQRLRTPLHNKLIDWPSTIFQWSRIRRDIAFTFVREAIDKTEPGLLEPAYEEARQSHITTSNLLDKGRQEYSPEAWRMLLAEHGATEGVRGRIVTVAGVMGYSRLPNTFDYYTSAHGYLFNGSNPYYLGSNAINAARHERIDGHEAKTGLWVCRSVAAVVRARRTSERMYEDTKNTVGVRLGSLASKSAARQSVLERP